MDNFFPQVDKRLLYFTYFPVNYAPEVSAVVYFAVSGALVFLTIRSRAQKWLYILAGTAFAEAIGYIFRTVCVYKTNMLLYVLMTLFLLLPPNAMALFNYKTQAEIIRLSNVDARRFWLKPKFVTWFFFSSDVFSILMQGAGGGMMTSYEMRNTGKMIALIGLIVQLFFFASFFFISVHVMRNPVYTVRQSKKDASPEAAKKKVMWVLLSTTIILYLRSIYRVAEFADGYAGVIYSCEWAFYVFDTILIFFAFLVYLYWFIGHNFTRVVPGLRDQGGDMAHGDGAVANNSTTGLTDAHPPPYSDKKVSASSF
ncbi:hypothetical protein EC988_003015 [Linderina pennispora]|nr:hypothetical protein EC988_003015 [Linderina pennispora]